MTVPGRVEAARTLLRLDPPAWFLRHARGVAEVAARIAADASRQGTPVSRPLVEAAALLHDVDKVLPAEDRARRLAHGAGSADWLSRQGFAELAASVAAHPVTRLDEPGAAAWLRNASLEELIVAYADKRVGQRLESMDERFASWQRRYPEPGMDVGRLRSLAGELEERVCRLAGIRPDEVGRLAWTSTALRRARDEEATARTLAGRLAGDAA